MRAAGHEGLDAEDLAQEALVRAIRSLEGLRGPADEALLRGWVDRIAVNLSGNRPPNPRAPAHGGPLPEDAERGPVDPDGADLVACRRSLGSLPADLPHEQRVDSLARVSKNAPAAQVAADLGISDNLVRWRLRTARQRLRECIDAMTS